MRPRIPRRFTDRDRSCSRSTTSVMNVIPSVTVASAIQSGGCSIATVREARTGSSPTLRFQNKKLSMCMAFGPGWLTSFRSPPRRVSRAVRLCRCRRVTRGRYRFARWRPACAAESADVGARDCRAAVSQRRVVVTRSRACRGRSRDWGRTRAVECVSGRQRPSRHVCWRDKRLRVAGAGPLRGGACIPVAV